MPDSGPDCGGDARYFANQFGSGTRPAFGHYKTMTGQIQPTIGSDGAEPISTGQLLRIHGGIRDTIATRIVQAIDVDAGAVVPPGGGLADRMDRHCPDAAVPTWEFAPRGIRVGIRPCSTPTG